MSVFLKPFAGVLAIALVFVAVILLGRRIERALELRTTGWSTSRSRAARGAVVLLGILALAFLSPPAVAIGIAVCSIVLLLWVRSVLPLRESLLLFAGLTALMLLGLSFYRPEPLATVTIQTKTRGVTSGDLITESSGTWYLGQAHRNFVVVPPAEIRSIKVDSGPYSSPPLFRRVLDALGL
jgi:hypothetical protein